MLAVIVKLFVLALATATLDPSSLLAEMRFNNKGRYSARLISEHLGSAMKLLEAAKLELKPEFKGWSFLEIDESQEKMSCGNDGAIRYHGRPSNQRIVFALSFCGYLHDPAADTLVVLPWYISLGKERLGFILEPDMDIYRKGANRLQEVARYLMKKRRRSIEKRTILVTDEDVDFHSSKDRLILPWNVPETTLIQLLLFSQKRPALTFRSDTKNGIQNWKNVELYLFALNMTSNHNPVDDIIFTDKAPTMLKTGSLILNISEN